MTGKENVDNGHKNFKEGKYKNTVKKVWKYTLTMELLTTYASASIASRDVGLSVSAITSACRNINKTSGGFIWRYEEFKTEEDEVRKAHFKRIIK